MILADTSVWVAHLRQPDQRLAALLREREIVMHPFVVGEIAMGNLHRRTTLLTSMRNLPMLDVVPWQAILTLVEDKRLYGRGIGVVDCHLLASARAAVVQLWSLDKRLAAAAQDLAVPVV